MAERITVQQNPGDLSLPKDWIITIKKNVLILGHKAELINPNKFDEVVLLSGYDYDEKEEEKALLETSLFGVA